MAKKSAFVPYGKAAAMGGKGKPPMGNKGPKKMPPFMKKK